MGGFYEIGEKLSSIISYRRSLTPLRPQNPGRTKEAWRQHWYGNRERLLRRAQTLGLEVLEEGSIFSDSFRVGRGSIASNSTEKPSIASSSTAPLDNDDDWMEGSSSEDEDEPPDPLAHHHVFTFPKLQSLSSPLSTPPPANLSPDRIDTSPRLHNPPPFFNISPRGGKRKADIVSASSPFVTIGGDEPLIVTGNLDQTFDSTSSNSADPPVSGVREPPQKRPNNSFGQGKYVDTASPRPDGNDNSTLAIDNVPMSGVEVTSKIVSVTSPLSDQEQGALAGLIVREGPNPPPGSLLRFAAKVSSYPGPRKTTYPLSLPESYAESVPYSRGVVAIPWE
jgi:hypothetical protein